MLGSSLSHTHNSHHRFLEIKRCSGLHTQQDKVSVLSGFVKFPCSDFRKCPSFEARTIHTYNNVLFQECCWKLLPQRQVKSFLCWLAVQGELHGARTTQQHSPTPLPPVPAGTRGAAEPPHRPHPALLQELSVLSVTHIQPNRISLFFVNDRRLKQRNWRSAINSSTSFQSFKSD